MCQFYCLFPHPDLAAVLTNRETWHHDFSGLPITAILDAWIFLVFGSKWLVDSGNGREVLPLIFPGLKWIESTTK